MSRVAPPRPIDASLEELRAIIRTSNEQGLDVADLEVLDATPRSLFIRCRLMSVDGWRMTELAQLASAAESTLLDVRDDQRTVRERAIRGASSLAPTRRTEGR